MNPITASPETVLPNQPSLPEKPHTTTDWKTHHKAMMEMEEYKREERTCISCYKPLCCLPQIRAKAAGNQGAVDMLTCLGNIFFCCYPCWMCGACCAAK